MLSSLIERHLNLSTQGILGARGAIRFTVPVLRDSAEASNPGPGKPIAASIFQEFTELREKKGVRVGFVP